MLRGSRGLPIFWQTLLLLLSSLIVTQLVSIVLLLALEPPRPDFNRLSDVAEVLAGGKLVEAQASTLVAGALT